MSFRGETLEFVWAIFAKKKSGLDSINMSQAAYLQFRAVNIKLIYF